MFIKYNVIYIMLLEFILRPRILFYSSDKLVAFKNKRLDPN